MATQGTSGLERLLKAFRFSMQGLAAAFKNEAAFRQETYLAVILVPLGFFLGDNSTEIILLIACLLIVLIVELINSAIEAVVDRLGSEYHELSGRAKDLGSAAVLLALINAALVWLLILLG